ncbi:MAG: RagB/SusD family nutrient uptake outer membrane protein [Prevotella sp.]|jgi:hypothetical protein|nr:RagB/SusD family nutrient uptake outer membrane protein [Prevotella sp.]
MKKYILSAVAVLSATTLFTSCNDSLDTDPRVTEMTSATFPGKPADVEALNAATYSIMNTLGGGDQSGICNNPFYWWCMMSDECFGSGGLQDNVNKSLHHFTTASSNQYEQEFILLYGGISRANNQIETIDNVNWTGIEAQRNQLLGEAYFMRGFYTLLLTQLFGDVPLITSTTITDEMQQQVSAEEVIYPQILSDFFSAKNLMKAERANGSGHADKFAAEGFMARAWMFWAGFYKKQLDLSSGDATMTLVEQEGCPAGTTLAKAQIIEGLKDVVDNGGYTLCKDFRSLWQYSNSFLWDEAHDEALKAEGKKQYAFIADMDRADCFDQPGMGNGNTEEIFQIQFMNASSWDIGGTYNNPRMYSNYLSCFWGLRNGATNDNGKRTKTYPFNQGWGQGTPSNNIWDDWDNADPRKLATLIDLDHELDGYTYEKDDNEESGYACKKYAEVNLWQNASDNDAWWEQCEGYSSSALGNPQQGDHFEDFYLMRYPDVLLMLSELTGDAQYMNVVRARVGLPAVSYSLKALQEERRWEFALEGLRFNDLRRWSGIDSGTSSLAANALQAQKGKSITCYGKKNSMTMEHMTSSWAKRYADTNGFLPKPQRQITLMNNAMQQNPGWDENTPAAEWTYKVLY